MVHLVTKVTFGLDWGHLILKKIYIPADVLQQLC